MPNTAFFLNLARIKLCCTEIFESKCIELVWHGIQLGGTADHWIQALRLSFTAGTLRYWCLLERQPRNVIEIQFIILEFWKEGGLVRCLCCFVRSVCVVSAYLSDWLLIIEPQVTSSICAPVVALLSHWIKVLHMQSRSTRMDPWIVCINGHIWAVLANVVILCKS